MSMCCVCCECGVYDECVVFVHFVSCAWCMWVIQTWCICGVQWGMCGVCVVMSSLCMTIMCGSLCRICVW